MNISRCCRHCDGQPSCVGWTLDKRELTCFTKSAMRSGGASPATGSISGLHPGVAPAPPSPKPPSPLAPEPPLPPDPPSPVTPCKGRCPKQGERRPRVAPRGMRHRHPLRPPFLPLLMLPGAAWELMCWPHPQRQHTSTHARTRTPFNRGSSSVLFVIADDMRPQLGCCGHDFMHTPHIDNLAATGTLFHRAYVQYAFCALSRNSADRNP